MGERFSIPAWALANPFAVIVTYIGIIAAAISSVLFVLPTRMMPYIESPLISVVTMAPGYAPQDVETYFSKPIEERMTDLHGVRFIRSISQRELSIVTLQFPYGSDMRRALVDVQQLAKQAEGDLPYDRANLKPSYVLPVDPLNAPILQLSVAATGWDPVQLRQFVANDVVRELKGVDGVQQIVPFGGLQRQLRVIVDRDAAASQGLSLLDVRDALDRQNVDASGGTLTGSNRESIVRETDRVNVASDFLGYPVKSEGERTIFLRDIAKVRDDAAERRSAYRFNGHDAIEISIIENPEANSPSVIAAVDAKLAQIMDAHPGLHFVRAYDNARFVTELTRNMLEELIVSVVLAGLVLLVFLEDIGATTIVMTSIPTCLGLAICLFVPFHLSINSSTLVGLLLAIGRLVDDSIVVIHAVHRKIESGISPARAAIDGTSEVILPIAAATGVMVLAVVPLLTSGGITQIMFAGLVLPIVFALLASLLVSLTLTPLLAAWIFRPLVGSDPTDLRRTLRERLDDVVRRALAPVHRGLTALDTAYRRALGWSLEHHAIVLSSAVIATYVGFSLFPLIGSEMMPLADTGQALAYLEVDPGASFALTYAKARAFEKILLAQPEVQRVSAEIGEAPANGYVNGQAMNGLTSVSYLVTLSPKEKRRRNIWEIMDAAYTQAYQKIPGLRRLTFEGMGSDIMATNAAPIELLVYGTDLTRVHEIAARVSDIARGVPGIVHVATSSALTQPEQRIQVDRGRAAELGLAPADVAMQAYYATHGGLTTEYFNPSNLRHDVILVRYASDTRAFSSDLARVQIVGKNGAVVPLRALALIERNVGPTLIEHDGLRRSVSVLGYYRKGGSGEMSLDMQTIMQASSLIPFPKGYGIELRGDMTELTTSFARLLNAMKVAILFVFLLLIAQFRSLAQPLVMLLAIPLQILGVAGGLLLAHQNLSTVSILGIVVANGMAVSNAILLLDLILQKRKAGLSVREAILEAGPVRLRPILMTTIVSLAVLIPVAFFPKTGVDAYSPLATVIIGGLTISTVLTLFVVPVLHDAFNELGARKNA
jgi:HAE1 family hydrophobic/amphiphilic exporter-1